MRVLTKRSWWRCFFWVTRTMGIGTALRWTKASIETQRNAERVWKEYKRRDRTA